jgi:hypothetical protein
LEPPASASQTGTQFLSTSNAWPAGQLVGGPDGLLLELHANVHQRRTLASAKTRAREGVAVLIKTDPPRAGLCATFLACPRPSIKRVRCERIRERALGGPPLDPRLNVERATGEPCRDQATHTRGGTLDRHDGTPSRVILGGMVNRHARRVLQREPRRARVVVHAGATRELRVPRRHDWSASVSR